MTSLNEFFESLGKTLKWDDQVQNAVQSALTESQGKVGDKSIQEALKNSFDSLTTIKNVEAAILTGKAPEEFNQNIARYYTGKTVSGIERNTAKAFEHFKNFVEPSVLKTIYGRDDLNASEKAEAAAAAAASAIQEKFTRVSSTNTEEYELKINQLKEQQAAAIGETEQKYQGELSTLKGQLGTLQNGLKVATLTSALSRVQNLISKPETVAKLALVSDAFQLQTNDQGQVIFLDKEGNTLEPSKAIEAFVQAENLIRANEAGQNRQTAPIDPLAGQQPGGGNAQTLTAQNAAAYTD